MCKVSILMSVYNDPLNYLKESVESIIAQTFTDFECIIIQDNPGRDDVEPFIQGFNDPRFKVYKNEKNLGLALSMNRAAGFASANVFARMDADDIADPRKLELGYDAISKKNADVVFSNYEFIDGNSKIIEDRYKRVFKDGYVVSEDIAMTPNQIHHPTVMMRKSVFEKVGGYRNFPCAQDSDLWLRLQENGAVFYSIAQPLLLYRINPQGTTQMKLFKQQLTTHYIYSLSLERIQTGKDSYSIENYECFLDSHGLNSKWQNKLFRFGWWCLTKAKSVVFPFNQILRLCAFVFVSHFRRYYLMARKKKRLLSKTANQ